MTSDPRSTPASGASTANAGCKTEADHQQPTQHEH
jgi:hypothetical protein